MGEMNMIEASSRRKFGRLMRWNIKSEKTGADEHAGLYTLIEKAGSSIVFLEPISLYTSRKQRHAFRPFPNRRNLFQKAI